MADLLETHSSPIILGCTNQPLLALLLCVRLSSGPALRHCFICLRRSSAISPVSSTKPDSFMPHVLCTPPLSNFPDKQFSHIFSLQRRIYASTSPP
ncbi:hypothetical protein HZ326_23174 [Fusarium oxysporum f. sp. albedinis]|nr:hypothetical protein HZ326_23174 [Fusarium oxysporum f. sp. albedinis]